MRLLIALHDVTPAHRVRIDRAERLLDSLGVREVAYLLVPRFHGSPPIDGDAGFLDWMHRGRPFRVAWLLHGYLHVETPPPRTHRPEVRERIARRLLTAGEGEFLSLDAAAVGERLDLGIESYLRACGRRPSGFVAPAWLFNGHLLPALRSRGFAFTEDHRRIHLAASGTSMACPVITWATRTGWRRILSCAVAPRLLTRWRDEPLLRVAIHPYDMDHPEVVASLRQVIERARRTRSESTYGEVVSGDGRGIQAAAGRSPDARGNGVSTR